MERLENKSLLRTDTLSPLKRNASDSSRSIPDIWLSATGARKLNLQRSSGNGMPPVKSGIDFMMANGTGGVNPKKDSLPLDGPGIRDTGIIEAGYSNTSTAFGTDSKAEDGLDTQEKCLLSHPCQEESQSADHSINLENMVSQSLSH